VEQLRRDFPQLTLVVNGGIRTVDEVKGFLRMFDGVMLGRAICENPYKVAELHRACFAPDWTFPSRDEVLERYADYVQRRFEAGDRLSVMLRQVLPLYAGQPGGRSFRRFISERASLPSTTPDVLFQSLRIVRSTASAA
jgi:tRNA-dihydrouridine synthase A